MNLLVKAPIGGGAPTTLSSTMSSPCVASDGINVYWTDQLASVVVKQPVGGGAITTIAAGQFGVNSIAVDAMSVDWGAGYDVMKVTPK